MPEFQKKSQKFTHRGMYWNGPVDAIPEGQQCLGVNIRAAQHDTVTQRPGLTSYSTLPSVSSVHTISVLNNFNTDLVAFTKLFVVGAGTSGASTGKLFVGSNAANLVNAAISPVLAPGHSITAFSGNPMTLVDMAPVGTNTGWKYIGDSNLNVSVGYYPGDTTASMARCITMGMTPPVATAIPTDAGAGMLNGSYQWCFAYRNKFTGARSNPSAATRVSMAAPALVLANRYANFTVPATPIDPITNAADTNVLVDIYRFGGTINDWRYVGTTSTGASFNDTLADAEILTAEAPPSVTDATGVTRFNLYRPFVTQCNAKYSTTDGSVIQSGIGGTWVLFANGADTFDLNWLQGSPISVKGHIFHIYQVLTTTSLELSEDPAGVLVSTSTDNPWATQTGNLKMGTPLPHIWGPYGTGFGGAYVFGCGSVGADAGTLYWTNGNDPDSMDVANSLVVTSPSEPLCGGCIYDGTPFVWSTERQFRVYPGNVAGQFTVQEIPGSKGIWAEYSLSVQSNGLSDQSVSWVGKDGIYDWSSGGGLRTLTDRDLYPFFPHDNQAGTNLATLFPFITGLPSTINAPSFSAANMKYHRLCWYQGELFYDFPCVVSAANQWHTLVYDTKQNGGWVSVDQYKATASTVSNSPVCRGIEIAASNMKVGVGVEVLDYTGAADAGNSIACRLITNQDNLGDPRTQKLYGDFMFDAAAGNSSITVTPRTGLGSTTLAPHTFATSARAQSIYVTVGTGLGVMDSTFGLDLTWTASSTPPTLYQFEYSFVPKPEYTGMRATDKTDDGYSGAKYLRGLCIESNTGGGTRSVDVLVDGTVAATLTVTASGQLELPFAITPVVGSEFQLQPTDVSNWQLFTVRWVWEKWPDLTIIQSNWMDLGTAKPKYIRSFSIPVSGPPAPSLSFTATYDGTTVYATTAVAPVSLSAKSPAQFSFNPPILAHQIKLTPSTPCRVWYEQIVWDAEEWPERATLYGPIEKLGDSGAKYLRGFELPIETNGAAVEMRLYYDTEIDTIGSSGIESLGTLTTDPLRKNVFPVTPSSPIIAHEFQLRSIGDARFWYNEIKWDFEPWPEFDTGRTPWTDCGDPGAKFMQGLVIPLDTGGLPVTFDLTYDIPGGTATTVVGPFTTAAGAKSAVPFSYAVPFICHEVQLSPRTNCRVWDKEIKWVFEPVPEMVATYTTQETDLDLPGYHYQFDAYIAYVGSADAPVFHVTTEYGTVNYTLPVSNGIYTRAYLMLQPQKGKWRVFSITSTGGVRVFMRDCEIRAKNWTDKGNYPSAFTSHHPFGGDSRASGAKI